MEMGSRGTDEWTPIGLRIILELKVVENSVRKNAHIRVFCAEFIVTKCVLSSSRHLVTPSDLHTFLHLIRARCRSLVVEGSVVCS